MKRAETYRFVADYGSDSVTLDEARELVDAAESFIDSVRESVDRKGEHRPSGDG